MADFDAILRKLEFSGSIDPSEFLEKLIIPQAGQPDPLEDLRIGFRKRVVEPCFNQISLLYQSLETDARKPSTKKKLSQLLDPVDNVELQNISKEYQTQLQKLLGVQLTSLKETVQTAKVKQSKLIDLWSDPLSLVKMVEKYHLEAEKILSSQIGSLKESTEQIGPKNIAQSVSSDNNINQNKKDIKDTAKNPVITTVSSAPKDSDSKNKEENKASLTSWSIAPQPSKTTEREQSSLEADEIIVTLSDKSLKDLSSLWKKLSPKVSKSADIPKEVIGQETDPMSLLNSGALWASLMRLAPWVILPPLVAKLGFELGGWLNKILDDNFNINNKMADLLVGKSEDILSRWDRQYKQSDTVASEVESERMKNIKSKGSNITVEDLDKDIEDEEKRVEKIIKENSVIAGSPRDWTRSTVAQKNDDFAYDRSQGLYAPEDLPGGDKNSNENYITYGLTSTLKAQNTRNIKKAYREYFKATQPNERMPFEEFEQKWQTNKGFKGKYQTDESKPSNNSENIQPSGTPIEYDKDGIPKPMADPIPVDKPKIAPVPLSKVTVPKESNTNNPEILKILTDTNKAIVSLHHTIKSQVPANGGLVNNIINQNTVNSGNDAPLGITSGRDPIYDFRSSWYRDSSSNTYT